MAAFLLLKVADRSTLYNMMCVWPFFFLSVCLVWKTLLRAFWIFFLRLRRRRYPMSKRSGLGMVSDGGPRRAEYVFLSPSDTTMKIDFIAKRSPNYYWYYYCAVHPGLVFLFDYPPPRINDCFGEIITVVELSLQ